MLEAVKPRVGGAVRVEENERVEEGVDVWVAVRETEEEGVWEREGDEEGV